MASHRSTGTPLDRAVVLLRQGNTRAAIDIIQRILKRTPHDTAALERLVQARLAANQADAARYGLERLIALAPDQSRYRRQLAMTYRLDRQLDKAQSILDEALMRDPADAATAAAKAELFFLQGEYDAAHTMLAPFLDHTPVHPAVTQSFARLAPRIDAQQRAVSMLRSTIASPIDATTRARLLFELGHLLDGLGHYDEAFKAYNAANALKPATIDEHAYRQAVVAMLDHWDRAAMEALPTSSGSSAPVIFIVGMPRSGTSLVEQIIASHPSVYGAGERTDLDAFVFALNGNTIDGANVLSRADMLTQRKVDDLSARYRATIDRVRGEHAWMTDKAPFNFLHLGVIAALCPKAKIVHCQREPMDTGLSIYFNNLVGFHAPPPSLKAIGQRINLYQQVMAHWKAVLPMPIHDVVYEQLVEDVESESKRLLGFLDLDWDDRCLSFYKTPRVTLTPSADQVRRPVMRSRTNRAVHYASHLEPLRIGLLDGASH